MKHSAFVGFPIDLRMEHRKAGDGIGLDLPGCSGLT